MPVSSTTNALSWPEERATSCISASAGSARLDPGLSYLDGARLYGPQDHDELPLADNLHPGPEAHARIGRRFAQFGFG